METKLSWKKAVFSNICNIYLGGNIIGKLKEKVFSQKLNCDINGSKYIFKKKGVFNNEILILDEAAKMQIGAINYNIWNTKALIRIGDKLFNWKFTSAWQTKWRIENSDGEMITYNGHENKGVIESQIENDLLLLSGLSITNYNRRSGSIAFYIVFFVIIFQQIMY